MGVRGCDLGTKEEETWPGSSRGHGAQGSAGGGFDRARWCVMHGYSCLVCACETMVLPRIVGASDLQTSPYAYLLLTAAWSAGGGGGHLVVTLGRDEATGD